MTDRQRRQCEGIIHTASVAAAAVGAGLAQVPGSDNAVIVPAQVTMAIGLANVFGIELTRSTALTAIGTASASTVGRTISQWLVGWIPGIGNAINATTAAGVTEALGWTLAYGFDENSIDY